MISRLDRVILSEIVPPFVGSTMLFTGLFFAGGELVRYAEFLQKGEGIWLVAQLILYTFPMVIALTFPMAMLLGTLLGFGRLSGDSEITALLAAGVSFERIAAPVAVFGLFISLIGYWFNETVVPNANYQRQAIIESVKAKGGASLRGVDAFDLPLRDGNGNLTAIHVESGVDPGTAALRDVSIALWQNGAPTTYIFAPRAEWIPGTKNWILKGGTIANIAVGSWGINHYQELRTDEVHATMGTPEQMEVLQRPVDQVTTSGLRRRSQVLREGGNTGSAREADVEIARRVALPFASLAFALIGAPLGVRPQRGGKGVGFGLSVLITFAYWMAMQVVSVLGRGGVLPPGLALMLPNLVCLAAAAFLIRRVLRS